MNKISFIFPIRNEEKRIENINLFIRWGKKNIKSFEIIFVSNGSTDKTLPKLKILKTKYKFIKYFSLKKSSRSLAIKKGVKSSKYNLIGICSIDNAWDLNFYNKSYQILNSNQFSIVFGPKDHSKSEIYRPINRTVISFFCNIFLKIVFGSLITEDTQCIKMFKKKDVKKIFNYLSSSNFFSECEFFILSKILMTKSLSIPVNVKDNKGKVDIFLIFKFVIEAIKFRFSHNFKKNYKKYLTF